MLASALEVSEGATVSLYELLVCISNGLSDQTRRQAFLSRLLSDVVDTFNSREMQSVLRDAKQFAAMLQFGSEHRFAFHVRTVLNILQSTMTASLLSSGDTSIRDLFDSSSSSEHDDDSEVKPSFALLVAVLPNMLRLNRQLSLVYTEPFLALLPPASLSLVRALDVKSLFNLHGLDYASFARAPTKKPARLVALEKAVIWLQNVRDYVSGIVAVAPWFGAAFFDNAQAVPMVADAMCAHVDRVPLSHLAVLLKHFLLRFVELTPPRYYARIVPLLQRFITLTVDRCDAAWKRLQQQDSGENKKQLRDEVFVEFYLRACSQKLWTALAAMLINPRERGFVLLSGKAKRKAANTKQPDFMASFAKAANCKLAEAEAENVDANANGKGKNKGKAARQWKQDAMVAVVLRERALLSTLLRGIKTSLSWPDNDTHARVAQVAAKLVTAVARGGGGQVELMAECVGVFECALLALSRKKVGDTQTNAVSELTILCVAVVVALGHVCADAMLQVFQRVPGVDRESARHISSIVQAEPGKHSVAAVRSALKAFNNKFVVGKQNAFEMAGK